MQRCTSPRSIVKSVDAVLIVHTARVGQEGLDKATKLQNIDMPGLFSLGADSNMNPSFLQAQAAGQLILDSATLPIPLTEDHLDETIRTATKNFTSLAAILREGHLVLAIAVVNLGKLLAADEPSPRTPVPNSSGSSLEAQAIYPPSGFPSLKIAREVREMIVALEKEMGVFKQSVRNVLEDTVQKREG
ncbi:hypothetical protein GYMLUDRAFT_258749 [Collybiopsis luxurians FD-317 M1]|nr:hypothetical protein GYMLUDRAFT_258749 [Collybiopsis luxurians FD-317 M1]